MPNIVNEGNDVEKPKGEPTPVHRFVRRIYGLNRVSPIRGFEFKNCVLTHVFLELTGVEITP